MTFYSFTVYYIHPTHHTWHAADRMEIALISLPPAQLRAQLSPTGKVINGGRTPDVAFPADQTSTERDVNPITPSGL